MSKIFPNSKHTICCPVIVPNCNMYGVNGLSNWLVYIGSYETSHKVFLNSSDYEIFDTLEEAVAYVDGIMKAVHALSPKEK